MSLNRRRNNVFGRIGDRYGSFIDSDHFLGRNAFEESWIAPPAMNVIKTDKYYDIEIAFPGYSKKNISLSVNNSVLEIVARKNEPNEKVSEGEYVKKEIKTDQLKKTFELSSQIDVDKIESTYDHGLLKVRLPKVNGGKSVRIIEVG